MPRGDASMLRRAAGAPRGNPAAARIVLRALLWTLPPPASRNLQRASSNPSTRSAAATWLQRESRHPLRVPVGVIGPREATPAQIAKSYEIGEGLARAGFVVVCGGRQGVMQAVCQGVARGGGMSIGLLPDTDASQANPHVGVVIATGIGEARNALIARAALCLIAIGDSFGTLSEVALGRQFGKTVIGLEGAAHVDGVEHVDSSRDAIARVAELALAVAS